MSLYLGCPVWVYKGWVGSFYPEGTKQSEFLREYARRLTAVEGNTTFYAVPDAEKLRHWTEVMPETFRFCPKLPRTISHAGKLQPHLEEALAFIQVMSQLGPRLGPMFLQLPPHYSPKLIDDLSAFLEAWPVQVRLAVEVRHPMWFEPPHQEALITLLQEQEKARVVTDTRPIRSLSGNPILKGSVYQTMLEAQERKRSNAKQTYAHPHPAGGGFTFLRFIGHPVMEQNAHFIAEWADYLADALEQGRDASGAASGSCYVFCHCPDPRLSPRLCREFHQQVNARFAIPPLPWDEIDSPIPGQPRLL